MGAADMESSLSKRKIFLVDDHPLVREWLMNLINQQPDLMVCGEAGSGPEACQRITRLKPDIAVVDISLAEGSGIEVIRDIRVLAPKTEVIVLSMHDESLYAERALRAGARGYVMKRETTKKIITAIRQVLEGKLYVSEKFAAAITARLMQGKKTADSPVEQLSDRELEVFRMLGAGVETRQIGESLHISMKTVQVYCARIKEKLGLANATELLREAMRWHESQ
jgi:DNA-binding NarL/FixJ family response regulator